MAMTKERLEKIAEEAIKIARGASKKSGEPGGEVTGSVAAAIVLAALTGGGTAVAGEIQAALLGEKYP